MVSLSRSVGETNCSQGSIRMLENQPLDSFFMKTLLSQICVEAFLMQPMVRVFQVTKNSKLPTEKKHLSSVLVCCLLLSSSVVQKVTKTRKAAPAEQHRQRLKLLQVFLTSKEYQSLFAAAYNRTRQLIFSATQGHHHSGETRRRGLQDSL